MNDLRQFVVKSNHYKRVRHLIGLCILTALTYFSETSGLQAQTKYTRFEHLTINDGLSSNRIRCIYRDSKDYLWMGTDIGLDKYDSYQVKNYRHGDGRFGAISSDVLISTGSACHSGETTISSVLQAMNLDFRTAASTVRISTGKHTTKEEIDFAVEVLVNAIKKLT